METTKRVFFNRWFFSCLAIGGIALIASLLSVQVFHLKPCTLCKLQRIPLVLLIVNSGFGILSSYKQGFFRVVQGCLLLGGVLGLGHFLVQMGVLPDPCRAQKDLHSVQEFSQLLTSPRCSELSWKILGMPVPLINAGLCFGVLGISISGNRRIRKSKGN